MIEFFDKVPLLRSSSIPGPPKFTPAPFAFVRATLPKEVLRRTVPLAASLHLPQDLFGSVEVFAAGVPDLLHQILRGPVPLGGWGPPPPLGRETHPPPGFLEGPPLPVCEGSPL